MNKFVAIGRVISDPSFRQVGGVDVCDFRLSVRTRGKDDAGYPKSIVIKCTIWRKLAEMARSAPAWCWMWTISTLSAQARCLQRLSPVTRMTRLLWVVRPRW